MHGQYKDVQCIDALSEVACNMLRNHVPQGSCRTSSSPHSKQPTASVYSGTPIGLCEFGIFFGKDETVEGLVLGLGFELGFVGGAGGGIR